MNSEQGSLQNPAPGPSRVQQDSKREGSNRDGASGPVSGHNLDGFLPCHDLLPAAYPEPSTDEGSADAAAAAAAALADAPLSSSFQGMDAESSFGHPVDLEDIQLQRLLPEQYPPSTSSNKTGEPATTSAAAGGRCNSGVPATSTSASSSSTAAPKFLLNLSDLPPLPTLKGEDILPATTAASTSSSSPSSSGLIHHPNGGFGAHSEVSSGSERRGLSLGLSFAGIPSSLASAEPRASTSSSSLNANNNEQQRQHSSILESMTGPLSKRLRTLHTMQQQGKEEPQKSNGFETDHGSCDTAEAVAVAPQPSSSRNLNNCEDQHQHEQQQPEQPTSNNNNNTKDVDQSNSSNSNDSNSSNDSSQAGSGSGPFLGGTTQTYSVTIETPPVAAVMKPKKIFHQKSLNDADFFDVFGKEALEAAVPTINGGGRSMTPTTSIAMSRPRRQRKDRTIWCDDCKMHYFECECPIHQAPLQIVDNPVQSRARASVPSSHLSLRQLRNGETGIFTKQKIPKGSRFGPMEGTMMRLPSLPSSSSLRPLALLIRGPGDATFELDVTSEETSNWMRYVRPAGSPQEHNIIIDQDGEHLFFTTSKVIGPRQELRVWYSPHYAKEWGLPVVQDENGEKILQSS